MNIAKCQTCGKEFKFFKSNKAGKYCSLKCCTTNKEWRSKQSELKKGKKVSEVTRRRMSESGKGRVFTEQHRKKISLSQKGRPAPWATGENSNWWKGGITEKNLGFRRSKKYRYWRNSVLKRDNYKCVKCNSHNTLHVDHIIPFASLLMEAKITGNYEALYDVDNGRVLCAGCHKKTNTYNSKTEKQIEARLISAIKDLWEDSKSEISLKEFYKMQTEKFINAVKNKLE